MSRTPPRLNRAYSLLEIKELQEDERIITGIATTVNADRVGDVMEPKGAEFKLPIPLLWQHNSREPVGEVFEAKVTASGIQIKARILKTDEPGELKNRLDLAWQSIKLKLVRGLSIGFQSIEAARIEGTFGYRFLKWLWLELSAVTIPANQDATITAIKALDAPYLAAIGDRGSAHSRSGASDVRVVRPTTQPRAPTMKKSIQEQKVAFEAEKAAKVAKMAELMPEDGATLDAAQQEAFDTLEQEVEAIDKHLARLETLDRLNKASAKGVEGGDSKAAAASRDTNRPVVTFKEQLPPGIGFARLAMCKMRSFKEFRDVAVIAKEMFPYDERLHAHIKATVEGATTTVTAWAGVLVDPTNLVNEFIEYLRPQTIVGKFGANGVPSLRRVPFNVRVIGQTAGGAAQWVGQGAPKPLTKWAFEATTLTWAKVAAIAVMSEELARFSSPSAEALIRDELASSIGARIDTDFVDPTVSAVSNVSPASITNGLSPLSSAGPSAANILTDIQNLLEQFITDNINPAGLVLIMPNTLALAASLLRNSLGQPEFPDLTMNGGRLLGIPVITSQYAASMSGWGNMVIAVHAPDIFLSDDGQVTIDASREASLQMLDNPTNNSATGTPTTMVSMWQTNSIAIRAERFINWARRRTGAVVYMDDVNWGSIGSPT